MSWKTETKIADLDPETTIEVACCRCQNGRYTTPAELLKMPSMRYAYVDEAEKTLRCHLRVCGGRVSLSIIYDDRTEGFVGGMA